MNNDKGFTLIEVLVAVMILGVALSLIVSLFGGGLRLVKNTENYSRAVALAREKLTEKLYVKGESIQEGELLGTVDGYEWELSANPLVDYEASKVEALSEFKRIEVRVRWKEGARSKEVFLYGLSPSG